MLKTWFTTLFRLGFWNVLTVFLYRMATRLRLFEWLWPEGKAFRTPLFDERVALPEHAADILENEAVLDEANACLTGRFRFFSHAEFSIGSLPDWYCNPYSGQRLSQFYVHWSRIPDFDPAVGDIKCLWDMSRCDWAVVIVRAYRLTNDQKYFALLHDWLSDWTEKNPSNIGLNWKCGQEAAIRMLHVLLAAYLLKEHRNPAEGLLRFVQDHCSRIAPTIRYAIAQNNNHGISEAAALYIGGAWLYSCLPPGKAETKRARHWHRLGTRWLENRVTTLIASDGSFSQYSLNYHRMVVDLLNMVEFWRRELELPELSDLFTSGRRRR